MGAGDLDAEAPIRIHFYFSSLSLSLSLSLYVSASFLCDFYKRRDHRVYVADDDRQSDSDRAVKRPAGASFYASAPLSLSLLFFFCFFFLTFRPSSVAAVRRRSRRRRRRRKGKEVMDLGCRSRRLAGAAVEQRVTSS